MKTIQSVINEMLGGLSSDIIAKYLTKEDESGQITMNFILDERIVSAIERIIALDPSLEIFVPVAEVFAEGLPFEWDRLTEEMSDVFLGFCPGKWQQEILSRLEKMIAEDFVTLYYYTLYHTSFDMEVYAAYKKALNVKQLESGQSVSIILNRDDIRKHADLLVRFADERFEKKLKSLSENEPIVINLDVKDKNGNKKTVIYKIHYNSFPDFDLDAYKSRFINVNNRKSINTDSPKICMNEIDSEKYLDMVVKHRINKVYFQDAETAILHYFIDFFDEKLNDNRKIRFINKYCEIYKHFSDYFGNHGKYDELSSEIQGNVILSWKNLLCYLIPEINDASGKNLNRFPSKNNSLCKNLVDMIMLYYLCFGLNLRNGAKKATWEVKILKSLYPNDTKKLKGILNRCRNFKENYYDKIIKQKNYVFISEENTNKSNGYWKQIIDIIQFTVDPDEIDNNYHKR